MEQWRKNSAINGERDFIDFRLICSFLKSIMWCRFLVCRRWYQVLLFFLFPYLFWLIGYTRSIRKVSSYVILMKKKIYLGQWQLRPYKVLLLKAQLCSCNFSGIYKILFQDCHQLPHDVFNFIPTLKFPPSQWCF